MVLFLTLPELQEINRTARN